MRTPKRIRQLAALILILFSALTLAWGLWPVDDSFQTLALRPQDLQLPTPDAVNALTEEEPSGGIASDMPAASLLEQRFLALEFPGRIRQGDSANIRLTLQLDEVAATPTAPEVQVRLDALQIPNVYDTHRVIAQARLDVAGLESIPAAGQTQLQPLLPGKEITFYWSIRSTSIAVYSGVVWFSLRYEPLDGSPPVEQMISAQPVEIECVNFAGLGGTPARLMGGAGILLGVLLSRDATSDFIKKYRKSRKPRSKPARKPTSSKHSARKTRTR